MEKNDLDQLIDISDLYYDLEEFRKREREELLFKDGYEAGKKRAERKAERKIQKKIIKYNISRGKSIEEMAEIFNISPEEVKILQKES